VLKSAELQDSKGLLKRKCLTAAESGGKVGNSCSPARYMAKRSLIRYAVAGVALIGRPGLPSLSGRNKYDKNRVRSVFAVT
jgi:hypothetical protein